MHMKTLKSPLVIYQAFEAASVSKDLARQASDAIADDFDAILSTLVSKDDLRMLKTEISAEIAGVKADIKVSKWTMYLILAIVALTNPVAEAFFKAILATH